MSWLFNKVATLALLSVLLGGCAAVGVDSSKRADANSAQTAQWQQQQQRLQQLGAWQLQADALLRSANAEGKVESGTVNLFWRHDAAGERIKIILPFARGSYELQHDASGASLRDSQGRQYRGASMTGLLWQKTGIEIPFAQLKDWVVGLTPNVAAIIDTKARTHSFAYQDWQVKFPAYVEVGFAGEQGKWQLPRKVYIYNQRLGESFALKLSILNWQRPAK